MEKDVDTLIHARGVYQNGVWRSACGALTSFDFIACRDEDVTCCDCVARRDRTGNNSALDVAYLYSGLDAYSNGEGNGDVGGEDLQDIVEGLTLDGVIEFMLEVGLAILSGLWVVVCGVASAVKAVCEWLSD